MKKIILLLTALFIVSCSNKKQAEDPLKQIQTASINLPSMVCTTCKKNITKAIYAVEGVKDVDVDVKRKIAEVKFVPLQTNIETIERAITETGYDANNKKRNPDAYEKLDACCKIDG